MNFIKVIMAVVLALGTTATASADYYVKTCNGNSCSYQLVRTPARNAVRSTVGYATSAPRVLVRTFRRGIFGRRVFTGYAAMPASSVRTTVIRTSEPSATYTAPATCDGTCDCPDCPAARVLSQFRISYATPRLTLGKYQATKDATSVAQVPAGNRSKDVVTQVRGKEAPLFLGSSDNDQPAYDGQAGPFYTLASVTLR